MKTINRLVLAAALLGPGAASSFATEPAPPTTGRVLVLDTERTLEGDIERVGGQYRVRRSLGGETWLNAEHTLRLCADCQEAYRFVRGRANLADPDEHLRLALWCREHDLRAEALAEVREAAQLRPEHAETKRLLACLEQAAAMPAPPAAPEEAEPARALPVEITTEAVGQFTTRVQPILMNSCAGCHATGRGGAFRLLRAGDVSNRKATQHNLAAVLAEVNVAQPQASAFLAKAAAVHGGMAQAPFKNRQAAAFCALENWVCATVSSNPQLRPDAAPSAPTVPQPVILPSAAVLPLAPAGFSEERPAPPPASSPGVKPQPATGPKESGVVPSVIDEFDPEEFNRGRRPS